MPPLAGFVHDELLDTAGNALSGATVLVKNPNGTNATLYTSATMGTTAANPAQADALGNVSFWAANGEYDLVVTPAGGAPQTPYRIRTIPAPGQALRIDRIEDRGIDVTGEPTWDVNAADNDAALASARTKAASGQTIMLPALLKIASDHNFTEGVNFWGRGGGTRKPGSRVLCTTATSRFSVGDQGAGQRGGLSGNCQIDGDNIATIPFYTGIAVSRHFVAMDVRNATETCHLLEGTQNSSFIGVDCTNAPTLVKVDRGAFTCRFIKGQYSQGSLYHLWFAANDRNFGAALKYTGNNAFEGCNFEQAKPGHLAGIFHEAGDGNVVRDCQVALAGDGTTYINSPTGILQGLATGAVSDNFMLDNVKVTGGSVGTALDIAAGARMIWSTRITIASWATGVTLGSTATVEAIVSPTFANTPTRYGGAGSEPARVMTRRANPQTFDMTAETNRVFAGTVGGTGFNRWALLGNGDFQRGDGSAAPVKVLGARGAAVADAAGGTVVDTEARAALNALLARLRAHGLIAP